MAPLTWDRHTPAPGNLEIHATVVARTSADLARLSRADFERVAARHPKALNLFLHRVLPRLRRTQLVRVLTELFGDLEPATIADLEAELVWTELAGGATLFREGDRGEDVYIVVNGRLRVTIADPNAPGGQRVVEEAGRGRAVGELALLTGEARAATVTAVRDSDLLRLSLASFDRLLDRHPRAMLQIARPAAWRLRQGGAGAQRGPPQRRRSRCSRPVRARRTLRSRRALPPRWANRGRCCGSPASTSIACSGVPASRRRRRTTRSA